MVKQQLGLGRQDEAPSDPIAIAQDLLFNAEWYLKQNPDVAEAGRDPLEHYHAHGAAEGRKAHPLFDAEWYLARNPDVADAGKDPLVHYLAYGAAEGRDPHPLFDTSWYLAQNRDVAEAGYNPLVHYCSSGAAEGRSPHPLFDVTWYRVRYPDVAAAGRDPLTHYLTDGADEGRDPHPVFDTSWYVEHNREVGAAGINPLVQYVTRGTLEGRSPHPLFDAAWYRACHPEAVDAGSDPLVHYLMVGADRGYDPHPLFDTAWYLAQNRDVAASGLNPLFHYLSSGAAEGRDPNPLFDTAWYLARNPAAARTGASPVKHYLLHGGRDGADPGPRFSTAFYRGANGLGEADIGAPLMHYLATGRAAGLRIAPVPAIPPGWGAPQGEAWRASIRTRMEERTAALARVDFGRPLPDDPATFSLITTIDDADPDLVRDLAESVEAQAFSDFEWLILCKGSSDPGIASLCSEIAARNARVRLLRVADDGHVASDERHLLEQAAGRYVVPVDPDDLLYPDTLALLAERLRHEAADPPVAIYGDEQTVDVEGEPVELIWHRPFSLAAAFSGVPAAHLLTFARDRALAAGVYAERRTRDCRNRDTVLRLAGGGGRVIHIPEVLCGRRVHEASASAEPAADAQVVGLRAGVLRGALALRGLDDRFRIEVQAGRSEAVRDGGGLPAVELDFVIPWTADGLGATEHNLRLLRKTPANRRVLYPSALEAKVAALRERMPELAGAWLSFETGAALCDAINAVGAGTFAKVVVSADVRLAHAEAALQAVGLLELDHRAGIVGGSLSVPGGMVLSMGLMAGFDGLVGAMFHGWPSASVPQSHARGRNWVSAFPAVALCIRADLLRAGCRIPDLDRLDAVHGTAFCLEAGRLGYACVLDDRMGGEVLVPMPAHVGAGEPARVRLAARFSRETASSPISPHLSRRGAMFGALPTPDEVAGRRRSRALELWPPLNLTLAPHLARHPTINLLLPGARLANLSGGPNTALNIAYRLASLGFSVRIISTDASVDPDLGPFWDHVVRISGGQGRLPHMTVVDASDRSKPAELGANDIFFATAWWTARMAYAARDLAGNRPFVYLIQDFEPILYPASTAYAAALETYALPHLPVVNTTLLRDYLVNEGIGLFSDPDHGARTLAFEPAIDRTYFHPDPEFFRAGDAPGRRPPETREKRRLLFYARPTAGVRNLFEIGLSALRAALAEHVLDAANWELVGMGEAFDPIDLGGGAKLACAPWLGFEAYARQMRRSDIVLSLMLSPHPSYPPLEMAGCGGIAVTNTYGSRTSAKMMALSPNIIAVEPNVPAIVEALIEAVGRLDDLDARAANSALALPSSWDESFAAVIPTLAEAIRAQGVPSDAPTRPRLGEPLHLGRPAPETGSAYAAFLDEAETRRALVNRGAPEPGLFCFVTTVWNTAPAYLDVLARSLHRQVGGQTFEWFILDNGTTRSDTRTYLQRLAGRRAYVRLERVEANLGIVGGMRYCLDRASGRYILPLDSDDYLFPDCLRTLAWYAQKHSYPALLYTDEDKLVGERQSDPFQKPDWDPVLFSAQCFIAHLCAIDRRLAVALDAYGDPAVEGSHDWDTFTRFHVAGHVPVHVPHVLYSWRLHPESTAGGNMESKPVVFASQRAVLERAIAGSPVGDRFDLLPSPLFGATPDWWLRRRRSGGRPITTIVVHTGTGAGGPQDLRLAAGLDHETRAVDLVAGLDELRPLVDEAALRGRLVHLIASGVVPDDDEWAWEAIGLFERHTDAIAVGGRIHAHGTVLETGRFLGFGDGCDCPDRDRSLADPGYAAQVWKPRSVGAVSALHALFDADFLASALALAHAGGGSIPHLGAWVGGHARRAGRRVIYSPFLSARTAVDYDALVDDAERSAFLSAFIDLMPDRALLPAGTGLTPETAYQPVPPAPRYQPAILLPDYAPWLMGHCERRADSLAATVAVQPAASAPLFSLLTTLYVRTDADLFALTADSVSAQSWRNFEWVVLAHGPTTPALDAKLERVAEDARVRLLRLPDNRGIMGGMQQVLHAARGTYVVPLDGDDMLTGDALALFARAIHEGDAPAFLYSDEDVMVAQTLQQPYLRPDWDPILDLENSWVWHACAMRRDIALQLDVYGDGAAEYCHDWDSLDRFVAAGHRPVHVPEIVYHWRHHAGSTSNAAGPNTVSADSVRHVLQRKIDRLGLADRCTVAPYPIWRGAQEWWIARDLEDLPPLIALAGPGGKPPPHFAIGPGVDLQCVAAWRAALARAPDTAIVAIVGSGIAATGGDITTREIVKLFEAFPDAVAVTGPVMRDEVVQSAGLACDAAGKLVDGLAGRPAGDPGLYALGWKPFSLTVPTSDWFFARAHFLKACLESLPAHAAGGEIALWLAARAAAEGRRVIFTPLAVAQAVGMPLYKFEPASTELAWRGFLATAAPKRRSGLQGNAAYLPPRSR